MRAVAGRTGRTGGVDACVVHDDVDAALLVYDRLHDAADVLVARHVELGRDDPRRSALGPRPRAVVRALFALEAGHGLELAGGGVHDAVVHCEGLASGASREGGQ